MDESSKSIMKRYSIPNKFDHAEYKTICHVMNNDVYDVYMQMSHHEDRPEWLYIESVPQKSTV
jgi:hypothetical protein